MGGREGALGSWCCLSWCQTLTQGKEKRKMNGSAPALHAHKQLGDTADTGGGGGRGSRAILSPGMHVSNAVYSVFDDPRPGFQQRSPALAAAFRPGNLIV